jgi:hypothetical protein
MARLGSIGTQYLDANGDPLGGGKLFFYAPGTTDLAVTYSDEAQTTANANPVVLDAAGRQPDIFYTGSLKIVLTDSDDVVVQERDPVSPAAGAAAWTWNTAQQDDAFTAVIGTYYTWIDADVVVSLPASPTAGDFIGLATPDSGSFSIAQTNATINGADPGTNGWTIHDTGNFNYVGLVYVDATQGWHLVMGEVVDGGS